MMRSQIGLSVFSSRANCFKSLGLGLEQFDADREAILNSVHVEASHIDLDPARLAAPS